MNRYSIVLVMLVAFGWGGACIESNPQPSPENKAGNDDATGGMTPDEGSKGSTYAVDSDEILVSARDEDNNLVVVGRPDAARDAQQGYYEADEGASYGGAFTVQNDGSFVFVIPTYLAESLVLNFEYLDSDYIATVEIVIPNREDADERSPWLIDSDSGFSEPSEGYPSGEDAQGGWNYDGQPTVTLLYLPNSQVAQVEGSAYSVTPQSLVVVSNLTHESSTVAQATNTGTFSATVEAVEGDLVSVFATNPLDSSKATAPLLLSVEQLQ